MAESAKPKSNSDFVQSLARGLDVIQAFSKDNHPMTLSDVAARTGLTRAAARRFLLTLTELGYVASDGKFFKLTPKLLDLSNAYLSSTALPDIAQPFLEEMTVRLHESSSVTVLDGTNIVYIARVVANRIMSANLHIGTRLPAYCTSMGRVLLAGLPGEQQDKYFEQADLVAHTDRTVTSAKELRKILATVKRQGYAIVDQELEQGLRSISAPITNKADEVIAAANVSGHASRVTKEDMVRRFLPPLREVAAGISRAYPQ